MREENLPAIHQNSIPLLVSLVVVVQTQNHRSPFYPQLVVADHE
jgi:hypothetical protein